MAGGHGGLDPLAEVVDLAGGGADVHLGVDQAGGPDHLLDHVGAVLELPRAGGGRQQDGLAGALDELLEPERSVVHGRRQPEPVVDQGLLPRPVAGVLAPELGDGHVALVEDDQEVLGEEVEQGEGGLPRGPAVEVPAVVLDAAAHPRLGQHLEVVLGAHAQPLGLEQFAGALELAEPLAQFGLDAGHGQLHPLVAGAVVGVGEDDQLVELVADLAGEHVEGPDALDGVAEELDADGVALVGGMDLDGVAPGPELTPGQVDVVPRVLEVDQPPEQGALVVHLPGVEGHDAVAVLLRRSQPVDARDRGHHDGVRPEQQARRAGMAQPVDLVVDGGVLLDVGVRRRDVRLGLVVVVVGDEVLDPVVGEELLELGGQLRGQGLVRLDDQGGPLDGLDGPGDGGRLARSGDAQQRLVPVAPFEPGHQPGDGLRLVAGGAERRHDLEFGHVADGTGRV